jgi:hypothetical protein
MAKPPDRSCRQIVRHRSRNRRPMLLVGEESDTVTYGEAPRASAPPEYVVFGLTPRGGTVL